MVEEEEVLLEVDMVDMEDGGSPTQVSWFAIFPEVAGQMSFACLLSALDH